MKRFVLLALVAVCLWVTPTMATTIAPNLDATTTFNASGGTFTGSITFTNTSGVAQGLIAFSLQLLGGNGVVSNLAMPDLPSGWEFFTGKLSNNGSPCNETNNENWICADGFGPSNSTSKTTFAMGNLAVGATTFTFSGDYTGTPLTTLDLMANGCSTTGYTFTAGNVSGQDTATVDCTATKWAWSAEITTNNHLPEPSGLTLLASGLIGLGGLVRKRYIERS